MSSVLLAPGKVRVEIALDPVYINLSSLHLIALADPSSGVDVSGVDEWIKQTADELSSAQMRTHRMIFGILYSAFEPDQEWPDFSAYLDNLANQDPGGMRNRFLKYMFASSGEIYVRHNQFMNVETFISQIDRSEIDEVIEEELFVEAHAWLSDPPAMRDTIVSHLRTMWREALAPEWERKKAFLQQVVDAFQSHDYSGLGAYEAIQRVTGRSAYGNWQRILASAEMLIFIPSPHIGPYLTQIAYPPVVRIVFGARLPRAAARHPVAFSQTDLLVQIRALADETRLRILELLLTEGELYAQEIIARLQLSKSSGSRHLSQLSATGYLSERQGAGKAKCYTLNPQRFLETIGFLERYART